MEDMKITSAAAISPIILRDRRSNWPAIPMTEALKAVEAVFIQSFNSLQTNQKLANVKHIQLGDVLAEKIVAKSPHPPFRASIKDGYAVVASDGAGPRKVIGSSIAEKGTTNVKVHAGVCCRINTGAAVPSGADSVVQVEDTTLLEHDNVEELRIMIAKQPKVGQDIREIGSDVALGELLLEAGTPLQPVDMGLLALSNYVDAYIYKKVRVAVLSTGDELTDQVILHDNKQGLINCFTAIRDTNRPVLLSLFKSLGAQVHDMGIAPDYKDDIVASVKKAFQASNILVVTGGVSMGDKDLLKQILSQDFGFKIHFGRVFMKPGLPTTFASGTFEGRTKFVFGLPGNPVSGFVTAQLFVCPMLKLLSGIKKYRNTRMLVKITEDIKLDPRPEYRRACLVQKATEIPEVQCLAGSQTSSRLLSLRSANMLLELPAAMPDKSVVYTGEILEALVVAPF